VNTQRIRTARRLGSTSLLTAAILTTSVAGMLVLGVGTANANTAAAPAACGYYEHGNTGYFSNCSGEDVTIEIDDWGSNSYACVPARSTANLGSAWDIDDAWVIHAGCN
jgi:hypothetical protein